MKNLGVYTATAVGAAAVSLAFLGAGAATADDYAGQTYGDASEAISGAGKTAVIATRSGDTPANDKCVVTHSESAPWLKGETFSPVTDTVLLDLNCNATVASAKKAGNSAASPQGRAALEEAKKPTKKTPSHQ